jgi:hypothetical protein
MVQLRCPGGQVSDLVKAPIGTIVAVLLIGCGPPPSNVDWLSLPLTDGREISDLNQFPDTAAVLMLDPSHCFTCGGELASWQGWMVRSPATRALSVVLLREPTLREANELQRQRIRVDAVVVHPDSLPSPGVLLLINRELRDSASGEGRSRALMNRWVQ